MGQKSNKDIKTRKAKQRGLHYDGVQYTPTAMPKYHGRADGERAAAAILRSRFELKGYVIYDEHSKLTEDQMKYLMTRIPKNQIIGEFIALTKEQDTDLHDHAKLMEEGRRLEAEQALRQGE